MIVQLNGNKVTIPETNYKGGGGEGKVYFLGGTAYKIYHDPISKMIPIGKILELTKIKSPRVLGPKEIINNPKNNTPIGFTMPYISDSGFLCWLFNKGYKQKNGIDIQLINKLVSQMSKTFDEIHSNGCIIADPNEMNFLISKNHNDIYFIDVDSYQTPSYRGTAVMKTVWDRKMPLGQFNKMTDYFGLAIITFQLYIGVHPYKCKHPGFKDVDIQKDLILMDHNISIFNKDVSLPRNAMPLNIIPDNMLDWYKNVFINGVRCLPPNPNEPLTIFVNQQIKILSSLLKQKDIYTFSENIIKYFNINLNDYFITKNAIYNKENKIKSITNNKDIYLIKIVNDISNIAVISGNINDIEIHLIDNTYIGSIYSNIPIIIDGENIYCSSNGTMYRYYISKISDNKYMLLSEKMCTVFESTAKSFKKIILQDAIGTCWAIIPVDNKKIANIRIKELDNHRILHGIFEYIDNTKFAIIISEYKGEFKRTFLEFNKNFEYTIVSTNCSSNDSANLTILANGIGVSFIDDKLELFRNINNIQSIFDFPFDSTVKLISKDLMTLIINENKLIHISTK